MSDAQRLTGWIETWWESINDFTLLLEDLGPDDWALPTDLPGWTVHDVAAHTAHLEAVLAGRAEETVEVREVAHSTSVMGRARQSGGTGNSVSERVDPGGRRLLQQNKSNKSA